MELRNNTILITGGASGFGLGFASRFLALGNTVIITGRDAGKLADAKKKFPALHTFQSDVSDVAQIEALAKTVVAQFPKLNLLINNAGEMRKILLHDTSLDLQNITREVEINLMGPIRMVHALLPHLQQQPTAAIVNVTSGLALLPFPISPIYGATKSGLRAYTKALRVQLQRTRIKVFELVAPAANTTLGDKFAGLQGAEGLKAMDAEKLIDVAMKGLQKDTLEIYPGMAGMMKLMSRLAPAFMLKQLGKVGANEFA